MTGARITLLDSQHAALTSLFDAPSDRRERAAIVLFRRLAIAVEGLPASDRYVAHEVIPFEDVWVTESSSTHIAFNMTPLRELFQRCEEEKLVFGFVHNHPTGLAEFSDTDEQNERVLTQVLGNRNGRNITFVAMLWTHGQWLARTRCARTPETAVPVRHILVLGQPIQLYGYSKSSEEHSAVQARQAAAFGQPFVDELQSLRVAVVGNGGTGSALATLIARAGIGELVLVDPDSLDASNLNRVRGLTKADVGKAKAIALKRFIDGIGLSVRVAAITANVDADPSAVDALASCDIMIGCTDDYAGRELLNAALYAYAQPLIDLGLGGRVVHPSGGDPCLRYHFGRISTILPECGQCLVCQGVVREDWVRAQLARREDPYITAQELKDRYLEDGGTDAPGVGPFTSAAADFALATLFDLVRSFRRFPPEVRRDMYCIDFVRMEINSHTTENKPDCPYCGTGSFLVLQESCRLNRPLLGKRDEAL